DVRGVGGGGGGALLFLDAGARGSLRSACGFRNRSDAVDVLAMGDGSNTPVDGGLRDTADRMGAATRRIDSAAGRGMVRVSADALFGAARSQDDLLPGGSRDRHRDHRRVCVG